MKVYIAGKITGDKGYYMKFKLAEICLRRIGYVVLSPAVLAAGMTPADYMRICFAMIDTADRVYFLPDWKQSKGAQLEHAYCKYIGKKMYEIDMDALKRLKEAGGTICYDRIAKDMGGIE